MLDSLKNSKKTVGVKQTLKAVETETAKTVFIAKDADEKVVHPIKQLCMNKSIELVLADNMKLLGKACGIEVGAAAACILK